MKKKGKFGTLKKLWEIDESSWHRAWPRRVIAKETRQSGSCKRRMAPVHDPCHQVEVPFLAIQQAEAVQENLDAKFPSFVKPMIRSNVTRGFWLSLPKLFCHLHLPSNDTMIILEDEDLRQYRTKYLAARRGLSAGWKGFSIAHNLVEGDVLVFQMVSFNKLKVYIISSSLFDEVDAALSLMHLDTDAKEISSGHFRTDHHRVLQPTGEKNLKSAPKNIADVHKSTPNGIPQVIDYSEKLSSDLQLALNDLISRTRSIADSVESRSPLDPSSSNDLSQWNNKQMMEYEQMLANLSEVHGQVDELLCLVLEPKPFYCNGYKDAAYMRNQDRGTAEVNILVLKENVEKLYSEIEFLKRNAEMLELNL